MPDAHDESKTWDAVATQVLERFAHDISETRDEASRPILGRFAQDYSATFDRVTRGGIDIVRGPLLHGMSATGTSSTATLTVEPPSAHIRIGAGSSTVGSEDVDYGPLVTLVALASGPSALVLAIVGDLTNPEEGFLCGVVFAVVLGVLYLYGNLDPIASWVAEQKRKHRAD